MCGAGERLLRRLAVAVLVFERQVVGQFLMDADRGCSQRFVGVDHNRQILVFDFDALGRVLREMLGLGHHHSHRLADKAHPAVRQSGPERNPHRAAADAFEERQHRRGLPVNRDDVGAGDDVQHALRLARLCRIDPHDFRMRAVGAEEVRSDLSVEVVIGGVAAAAGDQPEVFPPAPELMLCQFRIPNGRSKRSTRIAAISSCHPGESGNPATTGAYWAPRSAFAKASADRGFTRRSLVRKRVAGTTPNAWRYPIR